MSSGRSFHDIKWQMLGFFFFFFVFSIKGNTADIITQFVQRLLRNLFCCDHRGPLQRLYMENTTGSDVKFCDLTRENTSGF